MRTVSQLNLEGHAGPVPMISHQKGQGPSLAITANVHGDEVTGVAVVHAMDAWLTANLARGRVLLLPTVNPKGLSAGDRRYSGRDLNRCFPGGSRGGPANQAAARLWEMLATESLDAAVDLHADSPSAIPYALVDRAVHVSARVRRKLELESERLAQGSGLLWMREFPDEEYLRYRLDKSLAGALLNQARVPSVTLEVGPRRMIDPGSVQHMQRALQGICQVLGIASGEPPSADARGPFRRGVTARSKATGLVVPLLAPGESFESGDGLAEIRDIDGSVRDRVTATGPGVVVSWAEGAWVSRGATVGTLACEDV